MLNVTDLPLVLNVSRSFRCDMNVGYSLVNLVWEVSFHCALFTQVLSAYVFGFH